MTRLFMMIVLLACLLPNTYAGNDESYIDYLTKHGLKAKECAENNPGALFLIIREREHLGYGGTPGHQATTADVFYQKYLEALQPYNDSHHAEAAKARQDLRSLFYYLTDALSSTVGHRSYVTHQRIDSFVEHLIASLSEDGVFSTAWDLDLSVEETVSFLRTLYVLRTDTPLGKDFEAFRGKVAEMLWGLSKKFNFDPHNLHYFVIQFADQYPDPLEPAFYGSGKGP